MELNRFILATAGHVDHGKSALVHALTGTDPDRLPEEKLRGITIELGFAQLELRMPDALLSIGIVDVPGHEDFVKNMVAGVGSIDLALLVIAADDGWMPQTEEHLQILIYLGVRRVVVALTALSLTDVAVAREKNTLGVWRGDVITLSEFGEASAIADVMLSRSRRLPMKTRSIKHGTAMRVHHGSANFNARVFFQTSEELRAGETAIAQIRFEGPVFLFAGD